MKALRTPDERFKNLKGFPFEPKYVEVPHGEGGRLRIHYIDEGPRTADPGSGANREARKVLSKFDKPFLTAFSDGDPITGGGHRIFQEKVPGTKGQPHTTIKGGGHFLQEDCGEDFARVISDFIKKT